jgi:hypothetical protein
MSSLQSKILAALIAALMTICLLLGGVILATNPAHAADIVTDVAPPPPHVEHAPAARDGYVWAPGHWEWKGKAYLWVSGTWLVAHPKAHWVPDQWEHEGTQWRYAAGHWEH